MIKHYYFLIKPGIVIGNLTSSIGGFLIALKGYIFWPLFIKTMIGSALVVAGSCVFNNIIDKDIDAIMERTKNRILVRCNKTIYINSILYAGILSILGFLFLIFTKNLLVVYLAAIGMLVYLGVYSFWMKRKSVYSTVAGSISGSIPPLIGYCAVTNNLDLGAIILFFMFIFWQIPHSYSILILNIGEYKLAGIPVLPAEKGISLTQTHMTICIVGLIIMIALFAILGYASYIFLISTSILSIWWLYVGTYGYKVIKNSYLWAKKMFLLSVIIVLSINLSLFLDFLLLAK
ncbi:heme o synthase [Candidatus Blochmannia ocreatus (nom. nud.)]|uniref:Protoheme IX farnesyltransferase n=1 Tax=Candidatus Blochmannia ocreatus (nom. nud.) TaxID=251538 RepID=A0ABY4SYG5_9ENTR|nr:heme o synthase [Candidatus Blochmannia ocreatus]URJ25308.1 heme o synthase [Candidatus Blochmannia ocreatus]